MDFITTLPPLDVVAIIAALIGFLWLLYTILVMYHWFRYSPKPIYAVLVLVIHLFISTIIGMYAISGFLS